MRLLAVGVLVGVLAGCATTEAPPRNINSICSIFTEKPHWKKAVQRASNKWNTHVPTMMSVMYQESSFKATARPMKKIFFGLIETPQSSAYGYSQALDGTWSTYLHSTRQYGRQRDNFADSMDFMGWYMSVSRTKNGIKLTEADDHYLAYHEGWGGYSNRTYLKKPWLQGVAKQVQLRATKFNKEYANCRK